MENSDVNSSIYFVGIESFIIAGLIGIYNKSLIWGIGSFVVLVIVYAIPFLGGILSIIISAIEAQLIKLILLKFLTIPIASFITLFVFYAIMVVHRNFGVISKEENGKKAFRYSLIITECFILSSVVWYTQQSILIACIVFVLLSVVVFIPVLRVIGLLILTIGTSFFVWKVTHNTMEMKYSIGIVFIVLLYIGVNHVIVCLEHRKFENIHNKIVPHRETTDHKKDYYQQTYYLSTHNGYQNVLNDEGKYGEYLIYESLKEYEKLGAKFLFNCYLNKEEDSTTEIDVMLICNVGIFVFESKNYSGWIFGDENSLNWTQVLPIGKNQSKKSQFYNPVKQNDSHIRCLKKIIDSNIPVYSVIVFSDKCTLKDVKINIGNTYVIQCKELRLIVKKLIEHTEHKLNTEQITKLYNKLYPFTQVSDEVKEKHIKNIEKNIAHIKEEKEERLQLLICPRCGSKLVLRIAKRGENIGKSFYGCASYPECRYTREIEQTEVKNNK